uniref:Uncharacterized protein n=1 Tax=Chenopodium quinoa TaxID=63459 RepID=A0A803NER4_CHEQI
MDGLIKSPIITTHQILVPKVKIALLIHKLFGVNRFASDVAVLLVALDGLYMYV